MKRNFLILSLFCLFFSFNLASERDTKKQLIKKYLLIIQDGNNALDHGDPQIIEIIKGDIKRLHKEIELFEKANKSENHKNENDEELEKVKKNIDLMKESLDGLAAPTGRTRENKIKSNKAK